MWTTHGHQIIGTIAEDPVLSDRPPVARCGGPGMCSQCSKEAYQFRKDNDTDEFGNIPLLDGTASIDRMLGRVRYSMILTRPMSEVDFVTERLAQIIGEHKVLMEHHGADPETLKSKDIIGEPTEPGFYYNNGAAQVMIYLLDHQKQWWAIVDNSTMSKCQWGYIEQTTGVYPLRRLT